MSGIDVANIYIMMEVIITCTFTIDHDIEHNAKFRQLYDIINGDPAQLVKKIS